MKLIRTILARSQRELVVWYWDGHDQATMAEWLNVDRATVKRRLRLIRDRLMLAGLSLSRCPAKENVKVRQMNPSLLRRI